MPEALQSVEVITAPPPARATPLAPPPLAPPLLAPPPLALPPLGAAPPPPAPPPAPPPPPPAALTTPKSATTTVSLRALPWKKLPPNAAAGTTASAAALTTVIDFDASELEATFAAPKMGSLPARDSSGGRGGKESLPTRSAPPTPASPSRGLASSAARCRPRSSRWTRPRCRRRSSRLLSGRALRRGARAQRAFDRRHDARQHRAVLSRDGERAQAAAAPAHPRLSAWPAAAELATACTSPPPSTPCGRRRRSIDLGSLLRLGNALNAGTTARAAGFRIDTALQSARRPLRRRRFGARLPGALAAQGAAGAAALLREQTARLRRYQGRRRRGDRRASPSMPTSAPAAPLEAWRAAQQPAPWRTTRKELRRRAVDRRADGRIAEAIEAPPAAAPRIAGEVMAPFCDEAQAELAALTTT